jgi:hypothetical protein
MTIKDQPFDGPWLRIRHKNQSPAAIYSKMSERFLRGEIKKKKLRAIRLPGGQLITRKDWIDSYLLKYEIGHDVDRLVDETLRDMGV